ncbi:hypothetical protein FKM82_014641 [Ascaphus truei]
MLFLYFLLNGDAYSTDSSMLSSMRPSYFTQNPIQKHGPNADPLWHTLSRALQTFAPSFTSLGTASHAINCNPQLSWWEDSNHPSLLLSPRSGDLF